MIRKELFKNADDRYNYVEHVKQMGVFGLNKFSTLAKNLVAVVTVSLDALNSQLSIEHTKKHHQDFNSNRIKGETS